MNIISAQDVDLIEPFPTQEAKRVYGWMHCYKNMIETDVYPKTPEEYEEFFKTKLPFTRSFGVIDRDNKLGFKHEAPLVGMVIYEPASPYNCYIHVASPRRAWGKGFIDQAIVASIDHIFETEPSLLRISAFCLENNGPVKGLARRLGFKYEGCIFDMISQNGVPKNVLHFGMTRQNWEGLKSIGSSEAAA